nr:fimbria major subunit [Parabacteroides goldsteinii]
MKKFLYNIFVIFMSVCMITSCTKEYGIDDNGDDNEPNYNNGAGDRVSLSLKIPLGEAGLRGIVPDSTAIGEVMIDGVRVVLYGKNDSYIKYHWDYDIKLFYDAGSSGFVASGNDVKSFTVNNANMSIRIRAKKIPQDDYRMLVIVNPNDKIKSLTQEGHLLDELDTPFNTMEENSMYRMWKNQSGTNSVPAYFLMLNTQELIPIVKGNFWPTEEDAENNPVIGNVERVVAKVTCTHIGSGSGNLKSTLEAGDGRFVMHLGYDISGDYDLPDWITHCIYNSGPMACGGTYDRTTKVCNSCGIKYGFGLGNYTDIPRYVVATDLMWQVDIVNKKSYWYRHLANKAGNTTLEKYGDTDIANFYAKDPNFSGISGTSGVTNEFLYKTEVEYSNGKGNSFRRLAPVTYTYSPYWLWKTGDTDPVYVPENTMDGGEQRGDVVSRVIVKATLKRERFDTPANTSQIGDFFLFTGGVKGDSKYNMNNVDPNGNHFYLLPVENVADYKKGTVTTPVNLRGGTVSLETAIAKFVQDNPSFDWNDLTKNKKPAVSEYLLFYKNGEMYYEVPIKHFLESVGIGGYGRFGLVRNRGYQLNILDILSLGYPTIPPPSTNLIETKSSKSISLGRATDNGISFSWGTSELF